MPVDSPACRTALLGLFADRPTPRLYDRVVEVLRVRHYSRRTEAAYVHWIRRYLQFHRRRHPRGLAEEDVNRFLTHLAVDQRVAASTQNQALSAILFLYQHVLEQPLDRIPSTKGGEAGGSKGQVDEASHEPHVSAFVCHAFAG